MKKNTSSKGFAPFNWLKRMFFGGSKVVAEEGERYDSPSKLAVKRFFRKPIAVIALVVLISMFLFVFIGPVFYPVDLTETGSEMLHTNVAPTMSLMKLPDDMKDGAVDISWYDKNKTEFYTLEGGKKLFTHLAISIIIPAIFLITLEALHG